MAKDTLPRKSPTRKPLSKRLRFEIFKRDSFKCQYCGASAPDVLLHVDHIHPLAKGGEPKYITNLITACENCNAGKGARTLSDDAAVTKRKAQLDQLQERREQLEMMAEWQRGLVDLTELAVDECAELWKAVAAGYSLNDRGLGNLRDYIVKFGAAEVMSAIRVSGKYLEKVDGRYTQESVELAFGKIGGICITTRRQKSDPDLADLYRLRSMLQYRAPTLRSQDIMIGFSKLRAAGYTAAEIRPRMEQVQKWYEFHDTVSEMLQEAE
jgi:hypothetical protein